ncbi:amino acid/amide ABC transporter ATP-binding protein 2, HAAT family [Jannaschia faecimaris]|uniref:Amino acid/amide ABC transporter ATP-binding protein 2, HAAT family n=1 Tax=Jannaschia faecimaris TaxID=1244108 RepID=A0A1H3QW29_9RHOB|nr:urea ABC transporter ATP-binding subunit UrtE [Jannaschia faecimaris]SDZ17225.1 amino acid/amide ABC transporter ATP-binding protein 2, HAAT family [Jannaschia faecimaris]
MLEARDITLFYGGSQILHGIDLTAKRGQITCVMGLNGTGKTSLLKAMAGRHPMQGTVTLDGKPLPPGAKARAQAGIAYVPQGREVFPQLTVAENLATGFACLPRDARRVPEEVFDLFPVLRDMAGRRGGDLSGGQQQQLAIARALVTKPRVLLLDEPTEGIQPNIIDQIGHVIRGLRDAGDMAIVLVEQRFDFAWGLADRIVALRRGAVLRDEARGEADRAAILADVSV